MSNKNKTVYIDREQPCLQNVAAAFFITDEEGKQVNIDFTGKTILSMPAKDKSEKVFEILANKYDVHFIFNDNIPQIKFYPVPELVIFATDSLNGYFCSTNPNVNISEENSPIYYIDEKLNYYYLASSLQAFLNIIVFCTEWKEKLGLESKRTLPYELSKREYLIDMLHLQPKAFEPKDKESKIALIIYQSIEEAKMVIDFYDIQKEFDRLK